jgi:hypothetical protein
MPSLLLIIAESRPSISCLFTKAGEAAVQLARNVPRGPGGIPQNGGTQILLMARSLREDVHSSQKGAFQLKTLP